MQEQPGNDIHRVHTLTFASGAVELGYWELLGGWDWRGPGDYGRTFVRIGGDAEAVGTAAQVALGAADAVLAAVSDPATCTEDTPAIRRILAERAVLDAVRDWIDGDGRTTAVENAYAQLADVLAEGAP